MSVLATWDDFQGTNGAQLTNGNTIFDNVFGTTANYTFSTAFALPGLTTSARSTSTAFHYGVLSSPSHARHRDRLSIYVESIPPARIVFYELLVGDGSSVAMQLTLDTGGNLACRNVTTVPTGGTMPCPFNEWFDVEMDLDGAANQQFWLYRGANQFSTNQADASDSINAALTATNFSTSRLGRALAIGSSHTMYFGYKGEVTTSEIPTPYSPPAGNADANAQAAAAVGVAEEPSKRINAGAEVITSIVDAFSPSINLINDSFIQSAEFAVASGQASDAMVTALREYRLYRNVSALG